MTGEPVRVGDDHLLNDFGMRSVDDEEHGPSIELPVTPRLCNPHGGLHGGLMMTLIECGAARIAVRATGSTTIVAGDLTVRFLTPVRVGPARVVGRALRAGRRSVVVQADVIDVGADRRLCASASVGYHRLDAEGGASGGEEGDGGEGDGGGAAPLVAGPGGE